MGRREFLPQVEELKYLGVLFTSVGSMEHETDKQIDAGAAITQSMYQAIEEEYVLIYWLIYVPTLTCSHKLGVMTKKGKDLGHQWLK